MFIFYGVLEHTDTSEFQNFFTFFPPDSSTVADRCVGRGMKTTTTYTPKHPGEAAASTGYDALSRRMASRAAFRRFRELYREREELAGMSVATVLALRGAREVRCAGYLTVRPDLPPETYLEVPFVRRSWRLLRLLADRNGDSVGEYPCLCPRKRDNPITWDIRRSIGMDPATARINLGILIRILVDCGFLDCSASGWLSDITLRLVRHGSAGEYYQALLYRMFSRCSWVFDDGFPAVPVIPEHTLFLMWVLQRYPQGRSALDLADALRAADRLCVMENAAGSTISDVSGSVPSRPMSRHVLAAILHARFFARTGPILGLTELAESDMLHSGDAVHRRYRATPFAGHVLSWQL
jgi:hypothetical protein